MTTTQQSNPLLNLKSLPKFEEIEAQHVEPAMEIILENFQQSLTDLEKSITPTWDGIFKPLEAMSNPLYKSWGPVMHLNGVRNSDDLRAAYEKVHPRIIEVTLKTQQSEPIFSALRTLKNSDQWDSLDEAQQRIIDQKILEAELNGVGLAGAEKERFNEISKKLSEFQTKFQNNVLDATKIFSLVLKEKSEVDGLTASYLDLAAQSYNNSMIAKNGSQKQATGEKGPWLVTLDGPSFTPLLENCKNRSVREKVYRAFISRASSGEYDNTSNITEILKLRQEKAKLLGYSCYADMSLSQKMAKNVEEVYRLEEELRSVAMKHGAADVDDVRKLAAKNGLVGDLALWDFSFWATRLQEERFEFTDEELRPYFAFPKVLTGLFELVHRIFGITVEAADGDTQVWNKDVRFFKVYDENKTEIAAFYLDPYSRPSNKRGGAWMNECVIRSEVDGKIQNPVAYLICNCTPPLGDNPSLMTFREVETLFHEFGHGLQHMLTQIKYADASGISGVEWDAVELPSQFMENWCYHRKTLLSMAKHVESGETLPEDLYNKLCSSKTYLAGHMMLRQIYFGIVDMDIHSKFEPGGEQTVFDLQQKVAQETIVMQPLPEDRFLCSFGHIFAGGYGAGYYSYKWAEVLSADAFSAFEEVGLDDDEAVARVGRKFRDTVLALGGAKHPSDVFKEFRGRAPKTEPLLRHNGLN